MDCGWTCLLQLVAANLAVVLGAIWLVRRQFAVKRKFAVPAEGGAVVITGAASGIGFAAAVHLAGRGHVVYAGFRGLGDERNETRKDALLKAAGANAGNIRPVIIDVTKQETIREAAAHIERVEAAGIAGLVNSAGFNAGPYPVEFVDTAILAQQLDVNVTGQVRVVQAFMPLIRAGQGRVVFMSSVAGKIAGNFQGPYAASKFATEAIADSLRRELYPWKLSVSVINAGEIQTPLLHSYEAEAKAAKSNLAKIDPKAVEYYGAYYDNFNPTKAKFVGTVAQTSKAIHHALSSPFPKTRYTVAAKAMLKGHLYPSIFLGLPSWSVLPDRFLDSRMARSQWPRRLTPGGVESKKTK